MKLSKPITIVYRLDGQTIEESGLRAVEPYIVRIGDSVTLRLAFETSNGGSLSIDATTLIEVR